MYDSFRSAARRHADAVSTTQSDEYELITTNEERDAAQQPESPYRPSGEVEDYALREAAVYSGDQIIWLQRRMNASAHFMPSGLRTEESQVPHAGAATSHTQNQSETPQDTADSTNPPEALNLSSVGTEDGRERATTPDTEDEINTKDNNSTRTFADFVDRCLDHAGRMIIHTGGYVSAHNPLSATGRTQLKHALMRSGPAYQQQGSHSDTGKQSNFTGWRMGALLSCALLVFCLLTECALLIVALTKKTPYQEGYGNYLYRGSCSVAKRWSTLTSLLLNIVATLTISASNYIMQCLSSPSESELRRAHKNGRTLQLGVSSPSNIIYLSPRKTALWWLMGLSSIPVHLLLNSAFFSSLQTNNYGIAVVTSDYDTESLWSNCTENMSYYGTNDENPWTSLACSIAKEAHSYEKLDNRKCIEQYSNRLLTQRSNVILISNTSSSDRGDLARYSLGESHPFHYYSNFNFTIGHSWRDNSPDFSTSFNVSNFENELLDMPALFGIFDAMTYREWRSWYGIHLGNFSVTMTNISGEGQAALGNASDWRVTLGNIPINHCLSKNNTGEVCRLEYSSLIFGITIGCDMVKITVVLLALYILKEPPLVTVGDALATFLTNPEQYTQGRCLVDQDRALLESNFFWFLPLDFTRIVGEGTVADIWPEHFGRQSTAWTASNKRWFHAPSHQRWTSFFLLIITILATAGLVLEQGLANILGLATGENSWTAGFSSIDPNAIFQKTTFDDRDAEAGFMYQVLLVNLPQLLFSFLYFTYNGMFTCMHAAEEFAGFATQRKALRVSSPQSGQRSTYWLNLPWSYSVPLLVLSSILHWLVSRSVYLVNINVRGPDGAWQQNRDISACGFNNLMILLVIVVLLGMLLFLVACSFRKLDAQIPLVGTASVAISAICHHPNDPATEAVKPLLWGATERPRDGKPGHCALSSGPVEHPVVGEMYS